MSNQNHANLPEVETQADLFFHWRNKHKEEGKESLKNTLPCGAEASDNVINSFLDDGPLGDKTKDVPVLFICRESHADWNSSSPEFWMKEVVSCKYADESAYYQAEGKPTDGKDRRAQTKYYNFLSSCLTKLKELSAAAKETRLPDCAYININKRGGTVSCDLNRLANYAVCYAPYIKKQIKLLNPSCILICGNLPETILNIIRDARITENCEIYCYPRHPSVWSRKLLEKIDKI